MPQNVAGKARMTQTVTEILVVHHHQEVDEHRREQQPDRHVAERVVHALDLPVYLDRVAGRKLFLQFTRDLFDVDRYAAEISPWVLA